MSTPQTKKNLKILVTGGAGFMGSNFIRYIYNKYPNYQIYNLDKLTYSGNLDNLKDIESQEDSMPITKRRYYFIKGDICNSRLIEKLFNQYRFDVIINFAADSHVDRSIMNAQYFIKSNIIGVNTLLHYVRKYSYSRFIQISTDEVYGDITRGRSKEDSPIEPSNPYSASKAAADLLVQSYIKTHKLPLLMVRGSNNFGPYQYPEKLIPLTITNILEGYKIPVHGDGSQIRTWVHVNDFCDGIDLMMHKAKDYSIYNIAGEQLKNIEIIKIIATVLGKNYQDCINFIDDRPGGDKRYAPDATKIQTELGWQLKHHIKTHLPLVVEWYLNNQEWWKKLRRKKNFLVYYKKQCLSEY
jgi:dTDP-glucose 4,6-dehydratase